MPDRRDKEARRHHKPAAQDLSKCYMKMNFTPLTTEQMFNRIMSMIVSARDTRIAVEIGHEAGTQKRVLTVRER